MDYEKAYKDALGRARKMMNSKRSVVIGKQALETIFPELREGEDESIRKSIADCVSLMGEDDDVFSNHNVTKVQVLAWLKKQKINTEGDFGRGYDCGYEACLNSHGAEWLEKQKEQKHPNGCFTCDEYKKGYEEGRRNGFTAGYNKAMKEVEQKEQKPVECELEDAFKNYTDAGITVSCGDIVAKPKEQKPAVSREEILHQLFQNGSITLSDYLYLTGEKKQEWSEEDWKLLDANLH